MRRYETRSTMMTSNRPLEDWGKLLGDVPAASAILDRFLHHAEMIQITGKSYRMRGPGRGGQAVQEDSAGKVENGEERSKPASAEEGAPSSKQATLEKAPIGSKQATSEGAPIGTKTTKK